MSAYLLASGYFLGWWILMWVKLKDKSELLVASGIGAVLGPLVQLMHTADWWQPNYSCGQCLVHIEDVIFGWTVAGLAAVIYNFLIEKGERPDKKLQGKWGYLAIIILSSFAVSFGLFYIFRIHSFISVILASFLISLQIGGVRKDLVRPMVISGLLMMVLAYPFYLAGNLAIPGWIEKEWRLERLSGYRIGIVPVEELVWFFWTGVIFSCFWELIRGVRFRKV
jgi:hypothetical protein